jgi:hypothetical protein
MLVAAVGTRVVVATTPPGREEALEVLVASDRQWKRNDRDYRRLRERGEAPESELEEYAEYVAGLRRQLLEDCDAYRKLGGDPTEHDVECARIAAEAGGGQAVALASPSEVQTEGEKRDALDGELRRLESELDEIFRVRQARARARTREGAPVGGAAGADGSRRGDGNGAGQRSAGRRGERAGARKAGASADSGEGRGTRAAGGAMPPGSDPGGAGAGSAKPKDPQQAARSGAPEDVGTGIDDVVVARQLREAAQAEPDPLLREKLWDEYRKYKRASE